MRARPAPRSLAALMTAALAAPLLAAEPAAVASRIREVTVYADRARVTRAGTVSAPQGTAVFEFGKLPGWTDEDSIRAAVEPADAARILDVEVRREYLAVADNDELRKARAAVDEVTDQIAALDDDLKVLEARAKQIEQTRAFSLEKLPRDMAVRDVDVASYGKAVDYVTEALRGTAAARREAERRKRDLAPEVAARTRRVEELTRLCQLEQCSVLVTIDAPAARQLELSLTSLTPGATWEPAHELRSAAARPEAVSLSSFAVVSQTTGEDWEGAALSFSSQSPTETIRIPELDTLLVGADRLARPAPQRASSFSKAQRTYAEQNALWFYNGNPGSDVDFRGNLKRQEAMQARASLVVETLLQRGTTAHFAGRGRPTVRSDGRTIRIPIGDAELAATPKIIAAPEASLNAARTVALRNTTGQPLLMGPVALYQDGAFLGVTDLEFVSDGEAFALFLGVADQVKLSRMLDRRHSAIQRGRRTRVQAAFDIVAENLSDQPVSLTLTDRVPVSETREVEVRLGAVQPAAKPDSKGILTWDLALKPREKKALRLEYTVEYPQEYAQPRQTLDESVQPAPSAAGADLFQQIQSLESKF